MTGDWRIFVDTGGTFTDAIGRDPRGGWHRCKVLSRACLRATVAAQPEESQIELDASWDLPNGFFSGYRLADTSGNTVMIAGHRDAKVLEFDRGIPFPLKPGDPVEIQSPEEPPLLAARFLTRVRLNEDLPVAEMRLATTRATNALLERKGDPPVLLVTRGFRDLCRIGDQKRPELFQLAIPPREVLHSAVIEVDGRLSASGEEIAPLDEDALEAALDACGSGRDRAVAVCLLNSYADPRHEKRVAEILKGRGWRDIVISSGISASPDYLQRTVTTVVDAYLKRVMDRYFDAVAVPLHRSVFRIMNSAGGLMPRRRYHPVDGLLSGPAGGIQGAVHAARRAGWSRMLAFDMGGTSTDVSRWEGRLRARPTHQVGAARIAAPALHIETVASGGGSICGFRDESFFVGPESAGSWPGPACYGYGGPLTVTDVHLLLGRMDPEAMGIPVRLEPAEKAFLEVCEKAGVDPDEAVLADFLRMADEKMANAIQAVSQREGEDPADYGLVCFGGAGGLHACAIAELLGIAEVVVPADAGLLSALGLSIAQPECRREELVLRRLDKVHSFIASTAERLADRARSTLESEGHKTADIEAPEVMLELRLAGQESTVMVPFQAPESVEGDFLEKFARIFGYRPEGVLVELVRIVATARLQPVVVEREKFEGPGSVTRSSRRHWTWFGKWADCPVWRRAELPPGAVVEGPAIVADDYSTTVVQPGWRAVVGDRSSLRVQRMKNIRHGCRAGEKDPLAENVLRRELFQQRCAAIVGEMGVQLRRTALSTNIRERLDFSCALLDAKGRLLVNAPHVPVHLGAMGLCVREMLRRMNPEPGDVWITNHPAFGGSHLPDITIITPVFDDANRLVAFVSNRAHHAELGGLTPGSMPSAATCLEEEGVCLEPQYWMKGGGSRRGEVARQLRNARYPSRSVEENLADLDAQMAANRRGVELLRGLMGRYPDGIQTMFADLHDFAGQCMRQQLKRIGVMEIDSAAGGLLDDGWKIAVRLSRSVDGLVFDFSGTDGVHPGNLNATPAIVRSVLLYVLRLLIPDGIPLNEGLFGPIQMILPECFLNPGFDTDPRLCPAVVGGNVETSQILADTLVRLLGLCAGSQATMNNFLFGNERFGYYETIGGGTGAGPGFDGASGVHSHMTNTAITDPEVLERRFPVRLREFSIRRDSGGAGARRGGDGLIREVEFLEEMEVTLLSQRRVHAPQGLNGGMPGASGRQFWIGADGMPEAVGGKFHRRARPGDRIRIKTPGGGGFGIK